MEPVTKAAAHLKALESAGGRRDASVAEGVAHSSTFDTARARVVRQQVSEFFKDPEVQRRFEAWLAERGAA